MADASIRLLGPDDLPACLDLTASQGWARAADEWRMLFEQGTVYGVDAPDGLFEPPGTPALLVTCAATTYDGLCSIGSLIVRKEAHRQGWGSRLMHHAMSIATGHDPQTGAPQRAQTATRRHGEPAAPLSAPASTRRHDEPGAATTGYDPLTGPQHPDPPSPNSRRHTIEAPSALHSLSGERPATGFALYATPWGKPLYDHLGFQVVATMEALDRGPAEAAIAVPSTPVSRPATEADVPAMVALDRLATGCERRRLIEALPHWVEDLRVIDGPDGLLAAGGRRRRSDGALISPLAAVDEEAAVVLVAELAAAWSGPLRLDIVGPHERLRAWALAAGFTSSWTTTFMTYGDVPAVEPAVRIAPVSLSLG